VAPTIARAKRPFLTTGANESEEFIDKPVTTPNVETPGNAGEMKFALQIASRARRD